MGWNWDNFGYKSKRRPENDPVLLKQQNQALPRWDCPTPKPRADPAAGDAQSPEAPFTWGQNSGPADFTS